MITTDNTAMDNNDPDNERIIKNGISRMDSTNSSTIAGLSAAPYSPSINQKTRNRNISEFIIQSEQVYSSKI